MEDVEWRLGIGGVGTFSLGSGVYRVRSVGV